jgi:hypothetical protein
MPKNRTEVSPGLLGRPERLSPNARRVPGAEAGARRRCCSAYSRVPRILRWWRPVNVLIIAASIARQLPPGMDPAAAERTRTTTRRYTSEEIAHRTNLRTIAALSVKAIVGGPAP